MEGVTKPLWVVRFAAFEADFRARVLRKCGLEIKLQEKPFQILELLAERAGEVVTRRDLRERLWPDTYVGFERSLNTAINTLRKALGDSAKNPRFVETRAGRGYRFIARIETPGVETLGGTQLGEASASIAVLPFRNVSGGPEIEDLSDSITEGILNHLSQLPRVGVVAWNTVFRYKSLEVDAQALGRDLNVRAVLMGRLTQRGDTVLIGAELVSARTGCRLWGEHYHRKLSGTTEQQEISKEICDNLSQWLDGKTTA